MKEYYTATVKFGAIDETSGKEVVISEQYLLDAINFTDAETRIYEEMMPLINGEFDVCRITRLKLAEIISGEGETWYKAKIEIIETDEITGKPKKIKYLVLVNAKNTDQAVKTIEENMKTSLSPWSIFSITETKIKDIFLTDEK